MELNAAQINLILKAGEDPFDAKFKTSAPVEYVLGKALFREQLFNVNKNVLIPRIETEQMVDIALEAIVDRNEVSFADVATGSGVIGISFALELIKRAIQFDAYLSDISTEAIIVAKSNVDLILDPQHQNCFTNKVNESKIKIIESDLLSHYPKNKKFDIIFANLPYIPTARIQTLQESVKNFEPTLALDGGEQGLDLIQKLIEQARECMNPKGVLILEVDDTHTAEKAESLLLKLTTESLQLKAHSPKLRALNDEFGRNRFWIVRY